VDELEWVAELEMCLADTLQIYGQGSGSSKPNSNKACDEAVLQSPSQSSGNLA
jgi:hypothetical protein